MANVFNIAADAWARSPLRRRYDGLSPRERFLVWTCGAIVVLLVAYAVVGSLFDFRQAAVARYLNEQRDLEWMEQNRHLVARGEGARESGELLSTVVNSTAAEFGFRPRRTQTETDGVSARVEAEQFEKVLRWAHALESGHGVEITNADIDRSDPGQVDARFTLR